MPFIKEENVEFIEIEPLSNIIEEKDIDFFDNTQRKSFGVSGGFEEPKRGVVEAFKRGAKSSIPGMLATQDVQTTPPNQNVFERTAQSAGQIAGDLPVYAAGGVIGGPGGAFGLPAGVRKVLVDAYKNGKAKTFSDFKKRAGSAVFETVKGETTGLAVGAAGKVPGIAKIPAEIATLTTVGAGVEGQIPTAQDFIDSAILIGGLKGISKTSNVLRNHYANTGETPTKVADRLRPAIEKKKTIENIEPSKKGSNLRKLERQTIKKEAKVIEDKIATEHIKKTVVTQARQKARAAKEINKMVSEPEYFNKIIKDVREGKTPTIEQELAIKEINTSNFDLFVEAAKKVGRGELPIEDFRAIEKKTNSMFLEVVNPLASDAGRRLNMYNIEVGKRRVQNALGKLNKGMNERQKAELVDLVESQGLGDPRRVKNFTDRLPDPKLSEYVYEYWYNSILSAPSTHLVNTISNTAWNMYLPLHRVHTGIIDAINPVRILKGKPRNVYAQEAIPMLAGYAKGFIPGVKGATQILWNGTKDAESSKWSRDIGAGNLSAFERSPYKIFNNRAVVMANTSAVRALQAADILPRTMAGEAQLRAIAKRKALNAGLKGAERKAFEKKIVEETPENIKTMAQEFASHAVFMDAPGDFTKWIIKGREIVPVARINIPFVNTISNLTQRGLERTPGLGLGLEAYRKMSKQKNLPVEEVIANQIEGASIALYMLYKADRGEVTGMAPRDSAEKDAFYRQGKIPWGIKVGNTWVSYRRIEPINTPLASTAIAYDAIKNSDDEDTATEIFGRVASSWVDNFLDSSYLNGVTNLLDRYGRRKGTIQRLAASFVPYSSFGRSINRAIEVGIEGSTKVRDTSSFLGAFTQVIPGTYNMTVPRLNVWGEEIELPGGVFRQWLPYKISEGTTDAVELELEKLGYYPGLPGKNVTIDKVDVTLPDNIYRDYAIAYGAQSKKMMKDLLLRPTFQRLDDKRKMELLDDRLRRIKAPLLDRAKKEFKKVGNGELR